MSDMFKGCPGDSGVLEAERQRQSREIFVARGAAPGKMAATTTRPAVQGTNDENDD